MTIDAKTLTGRGNYYEDFIVGDVYEHARGKTMEALENVLLTNLVLNTAQLHFNEDLAEKIAAQKHRIVFGGVTASLVVGLAMQDTGEQAVEEVGLDKVRFRISVIHGDTLYAFTEVVAKDDSLGVRRGHRNVGLVHFRHWGINQRNERVFEGERRALIKKRSFTTAGLEADDAVTTPSAPRASTKLGMRSKTNARVVKRVAVAAKQIKKRAAKPRPLAKAKKKIGAKKRS
jgi:acyl dehydratase